MSSTDEYRARLVKHCVHDKIHIQTPESSAEIHAVTFQPLTRRRNQDRLVMQQFAVHEQEWLLLGVCDGHNGSSTARYTASHLPSRIRAMLERSVNSDLRGPLTRESISEKASLLSSELKRCIKDFDIELGRVIETLCPNPGELSERAACSLVREYPDTLARACAGTTLAAALVNLTHRIMWAVNVGDSTVALSTADSDGKRIAHELCSRHCITDAEEYSRLIHGHPNELSVVERGRVLGSLAVTRSIGDWSYKLPAAYSTHLFRYLSIVGPNRVSERFAKRIISPPYLTADPSIRCVDLETVWDQKPMLMLYTDGVDHLVNTCRYYNLWRPEGVIPSRMVAVLLQDELDDTAGEVLGYPVDLRWSGDLDNKAVDVLGNLLGGTQNRILSLITDQDLLDDRDSQLGLYIDDTSIVLCSLKDTPHDT